MKKIVFSILIFISIFLAIPNIYAESTIDSLNDNIVTVTVTGEYDYDKAVEVVNLVNIEREKEGLAPLELDKELTEIAMMRATELSIYIGHTRPNGETWDTISPRGDEENYAYLINTSKAVVQAWMNSESHKNAILNENHKSIGVGCYTNYGKTYWIQIFSSEEALEEITESGIIEKESSVEVDEKNLNFNVYYDGGNNPITVSQGTPLKPQRIQNINFINLASEVNLSSTDFEWKSSDEKIFTVDENGVITAVSSGTATLFMSIGNQVKEYPVQVTIDLEEIFLPKEFRILNGKSLTLEPVYLPIGSSIPAYQFAKWTSSDTTVATVDSKGVITAKNVGTTIITLKIGEIEASTEVTVYEQQVGDVNSDGIIDFKDVLGSMRLAIGRINTAIEKKKLADINGNGRVDFIDIFYIIHVAFNRR